MIVKPKARYEFGDEFTEALTGRQHGSPIGVRTIPSAPKDGVFIECIGVQPKSSEGKRVTVWIPPELVDLVLLELRDNAIARRR